MESSKRYRPCILATCCVPWNEDWTFAEAVFRRSVRNLIAQGIRDLYTFGTAGEGYAVTESQFDEITRVFLEETRGEGVQSMVGLISISLPAVIERIERARAMGSRRFLLSLPGWGALNDAELDTFFRETCGRFPDCRFHDPAFPLRLVPPYAEGSERAFRRCAQSLSRDYPHWLPESFHFESLTGT